MAVPQKVGLRRSSVEGNIPTAEQIDLGELAFNTKDGEIYFKDEAGNIHNLTDKFTKSEVENLLSGLTTNDVAEGDNLYFTEQRAQDSISVDGDLSYSEGVISFNETYSSASEIKIAYENNPNTNAFTDDDVTKLQGIEQNAEVNTVTSVNNKTGGVILTTEDISEQTSLYFTEQRVRDSIGVDGVLSYNQSTGVISASAQSVKSDLEALKNTHFMTDVEKSNAQTNSLLMHFL